MLGDNLRDVLGPSWDLARVKSVGEDVSDALLAGGCAVSGTDCSSKRAV